MRYIDADALKEESNSLIVTIIGGRLYGKKFLSKTMEEYKKSILRIIDEQPTADVVPNSKVENYKQVAEYQQKLAMDRYFEIKRLQEEIERLTINMNAYGLTAKRLKEDVDRLQDINNRQVENVRLAKQEVAMEIFEEIDGITDLFAKGLIGELEMYDMLAELKKKYPEEKDNES